MEPTPWSGHLVAKPATFFYFGYDAGGGLIVILTITYSGEQWLCQAGPGRPTSRIPSIHEMSYEDYPAYTFDLVPPRPMREEGVCVLAHPFALAYLHAAEMMAWKEIEHIGKTTARDTFQLQMPVRTPCLLTNMLGTPHVTLVLSARYDLEVR